MNKQLIKRWLTDNYGNLEKYTTDGYPNHIFYMKDGEVMFDYNRKNGYCHINYGEIWLFLSSMFSMEYEEIQKVTKEWVGEHYKLGVNK